MVIYIGVCVCTVGLFTMILARNTWKHWLCCATKLLQSSRFPVRYVVLLVREAPKVRHHPYKAFFSHAPEYPSLQKVSVPVCPPAHASGLKHDRMVSLVLVARQYPSSTLRVSRVLPESLALVCSGAFEQIGAEEISATVQPWQSSHEGHPSQTLS